MGNYLIVSQSRGLQLLQEFETLATAEEQLADLSDFRAFLHFQEYWMWNTFVCAAFWTVAVP